MMGVLVSCPRCKHQQMLGRNPVDGRVVWWTACEECDEQNIGMAPPDESAIRAIVRYMKLGEEG